MSKSALLEMIDSIDRSSEHHQITGRHFIFFTAKKPTGVFDISSPGKSADLPASGPVV